MPKSQNNPHDMICLIAKKKLGYYNEWKLNSRKRLKIFVIQLCHCWFENKTDAEVDWK